jgi:FKBP-type peptidyl-prolyl cis-trans isomerase SlyD
MSAFQMEKREVASISWLAFTAKASLVAVQDSAGQVAMLWDQCVNLLRRADRFQPPVFLLQLLHPSLYVVEIGPHQIADRNQEQHRGEDNFVRIGKTADNGVGRREQTADLGISGISGFSRIAAASYQPLTHRGFVLKIEKHTVVSADFRLYDRDGRLIDSSDANGALVYLHGAEQLLPALEEALEDHVVGDELSVELSPEQAFGQRDDALVDRAPRQNFPGIEHIEPGMRFQTEMDDGSQMIVTVTEVDDEWVTVDGNHELAGMDLRFELTVVDVRAASEDEVAHGHVHGPDGHHH